MKKNNYLIIILSILLVIAIIIIIQTNISVNQKIEQAKEEGYQIAAHQLFDRLKICEPIPIHGENATINAIAMECFQPLEPGTTIPEE